MEDYTFLLIAIALSIFGAINQSRKKKAAENPAAEKTERPRNSFMDQFFGESFLDQPKVATTTPRRKEPVQAMSASEMSKVSTSGGLYHPGFKRNLTDLQKRNLNQSVKKPVIVEPEPETDLDDSPSYLEDFSLRKAFVYSEIMTRKY